MDPQLAAVGHVLGDELVGVDVNPALCFVDAEWGLFASPFRLDGVLVAWPKATVTAIRRPGPLTAERVAALGALLVAKRRPS